MSDKWRKEIDDLEMVRFALKDQKGKRKISLLIHSYNRNYLTHKPIVCYEMHIFDKDLANTIEIKSTDIIEGVNCNEKFNNGNSLFSYDIKEILDKLNIKNRPPYKKIGKILSDNPEIRKIKNKYGKNKWWESTDPAVIVLNQFYEDKLLVSNLGIYHGNLEILLDRPVYIAEFGSFSRNRLEREIKDSIERFSIQGNYKLSKRESEKRELNAISEMMDYCTKNGKDIVFPNINLNLDKDLN